MKIQELTETQVLSKEALRAVVGNEEQELLLRLRAKELKITTTFDKKLKDMKKKVANSNIEYENFCNFGDELWSLTDGQIIDYAIHEMEKINFIKKNDILDQCIIRMEKAYPSYFGTYDKFYMLKEYLNCFENLFLIGRNGTHRYR